MQVLSKTALKYHPLKLERVLADLVAEGLITRDQPASLLVKLAGGVDKRHPLVIIAEMGWGHAHPRRPPPVPRKGGRPAVLPDRSADDRPRQGDQRPVVRLCRPAGRAAG